MRNINALCPELVEDLSTGRIVANPSDEGGVATEASDSDHRGCNHASALFKATSNRGAAFRRWDFAEEE